MIRYPLVFSFGVLSAFGWLAAQPPLGIRGTPRKIEPFRAGLVTFTGSMILARALFVALHATYYAHHLWEVVWLWQGGLSAIGAILGGLIGLVIYAWAMKAPPLMLADRLALPAAWIALAAWAGCWIEGCAFGLPMPGSSFSKLGRDPFLSTIPRWPTQALGASLTALLTVTLYGLSKKPTPPGLAVSTLLAGLACTLFAVSLFRADPSLTAWGQRLDTLGSAALGTLGLSFLLLRWRARHIPEA